MATFDELLELVAPLIDHHDAQKAVNSSRTPIHPKTKLDMMLRWLAGGSYVDLGFAWGIGGILFYSDRGVIWPTIEALDEVFQMGLPINDPVRLEQLSKGFYDHSGEIFDGCVIAMDGLAVQACAQFTTEVNKQKNYRYQKGTFAIIVLAGCDADCRFITATAKHSGSTNDIVTVQDTKLYQAVEIDQLLPSKYFFIGNEAFTNTNPFLSPWPGT